MDYNGCEATKKKKETGSGEIEEIIDEVEKRYRRFRNFDIVSDHPADHHFVRTKKYGERIAVGSSVWKKIKEEWNTLSTSLPDWIYVRAYEKRVDLMRAVIIGPPGNPNYYQGLFFFDISFPSSYPSRPPNLFHHSNHCGGFDFNPNDLHRKVSSTFLDSLYGLLLPSGGGGGGHTEISSNNILDLLVSIRGLVLNAEPPSLMMGCEAMIHTLANPPMHFEYFVAGHFRNQAHAILVNFRAHVDLHTNQDMTCLFLKLLDVFQANGTYCQHHLAHVKTRPKTKTITSSYEYLR